MLLPAALIAAGIIPLVGILLMPGALVLLYLLYRRFGMYLPVFVIVAYGVLSLTLNYDVISLVLVCFLSAAFFSLVFAMQFKPYLLRAGIALVVFSLAMWLGCGIVSLTEKASVPDVAASYVSERSGVPFFNRFIRSVYLNGDVDIDERIQEDNPEFMSAATEYTEQYIKDELNGYVPYYCIHFGAAFGLIAFFAATLINSYTASPFDDNVTEKNIKLSSRALGGAYRDGIAMRDMRLPRLYLLIFVLPALISCIIMSIAGGLEAQTATVMHACITMPSEFAFVTLATYIATLFTGKGRVIAVTVLSILLLANAFSIVLLVCSIFGVCDCILNLRYWINYLSSD